jgi:hypothetical protein
VIISEESPQTADPERSERLVIGITRYRSEGRQHRWADRKTRKVEDHLAALLRELETRAVEDAKRIVDEQKAKAERRRRWGLAMANAQRRAHEERDAAALRDQVSSWRQAQEIASYCDVSTATES